MIEASVIQNPACVGLKKLPGRTPVIPAQRAGVYYRNKEDSALLRSLNGMYRFAYREADELPDFFQPDWDDSEWDTIDVPSMWQYRGYGKCTYTNISYPFPFDPPYIDAENPVGYYRRSFHLAQKTARTILHFAGVDNAFFVYVNGVFAGFSKGSRNAAEFDVSGLVRSGDNLLAVKVMTYSDASYLEGQDMLLANGIFRDVYLLQLGAVSLWDYRVTSDLHAFTVALTLDYHGEPDYAVEITLNGKTQHFPASAHLSAVFPIDRPHLWNAEDPYLYPLTVTLLHGAVPTEIHSKKVGMMHSEIRGSQFLVNGAPICFKGVNRHETDCDNGRAISCDAIEKEVRMIKANNLNAVRCSHYPNDPSFYEFCSEIGLYVMDEADLETHGCVETGDQGYLSKRPEWREAYLDRIRRMMEQDKNEVCVVMRSMGNECGAGENLLAGQRLTMAFDPDHVAIHDQETDWAKLEHGAPLAPTDFLLRMGYLSETQLKAVDRSLPLYMQIEYAHAMGNSPGFLMGYQDFVYSHEKCIGGFVWEFKSHGFHRKNPDGTDDYLYGGDFGDRGHWANFCLDGYLMSDGTPKYTWYELFEAFSPVYVTGDGTHLQIRNTYDFRPLDALTCRAELREDTAIIGSWRGRLPAAAPHETVPFSVPLTVENPKPGASYFLDLHFYDGETNVGNAQRPLGVLCAPVPYRPAAGTLDWARDKNGAVLVRNAAFSVVIDNGMIVRYTRNGVPLIDSPMAFNFWRAPTDNDGIRGMYRWAERDAITWAEALLDTLRFFPRTVTAERQADRVRVLAHGCVLPQSRYYGLETDVQYDIFADGTIQIVIHGEPYGKWPEHLPRIGIALTLDEKYRRLTWYGRGPRENYSDCRAAAPVGRYQADCAQSYTVFDRPQESGNHEDTAYLQLGDENGENLTFIGCRSFAFSMHDFSLDTLTHARHRSDLNRDGKIHLYLDYKMRGLGSHSCGPLPEPAFELTPHPFTFAFVLAGSRPESEALTLARTDFGTVSGQTAAAVHFGEKIEMDNRLL